jgi:hypothetical protein
VSLQWSASGSGKERGTRHGARDVVRGKRRATVWLYSVKYNAAYLRQNLLLLILEYYGNVVSTAIALRMLLVLSLLAS